MNGLAVLGVITLTWVLILVVEKHNPKLGAILSSLSVYPFVLLFVGVIGRLLYIGVHKIFICNRSEAKARNTSQSNSTALNSTTNDKDLYIKRKQQNVSPNCIECQITTKENAQLWTGRCNLHCGKVQSVTLCAGVAAETIVVNVTQEATGTKYIVEDGSSIIGRIEKTAKGLKYLDADNNPGGSVVRKTRINLGLGEFADWLITWDTFVGFNSKSKFQYYLFRDGNEKTVGKYFGALGNIDLTRDSNNRLDRRIAAVFAMFLEFEEFERQGNCVFIPETRRLPDFDGVGFVSGVALLIAFSFILYYAVASLVEWVL